ncbi:hypothetical protein [Tepidanaerobacter acetatoxydans]|uniref:hypothetical protein n=1 Tax=Tepidanaerobacter acetatoxydans TaxID=499229 RepID=UPI0023F11E4F
MTQLIQKARDGIVKFFKDFSNLDVEVIDITEGAKDLSALCKFPDGEYQVLLNDDFTIKAYYRKKPYKHDLNTNDKTSGNNVILNNSKPANPGISNVKKPELSNSEQVVALIVKKNPGINAYEIRKEINMRFVMLIPILQKLLSFGVIKKDGEKYY